MRERLHERVLHRFVGLGAVPQVVTGEPDRAALMPRHEVGVALARLVPASGQHQLLDFRRQLGFDASHGRLSTGDAGAFTGDRPLIISYVLAENGVYSAPGARCGGTSSQYTREPSARPAHARAAV